MRHGVHVRWWLVLLSGLVTLPFFGVRMQAQISLKNFVAPVVQDNQGSRTTLKGKAAKPLGGGQFEITGMEIETYRGEAKDISVEAPLCTYDPRANVAWSSEELSLSTGNDRFAVQGKGFRWDRGNSHLVISNQVRTIVRKDLGGANPSALTAPAAPATPGVSSPSVSGQSAQTNTLGSAAGKIEIRSDRLDYRADMAVFSGNVQVQDEDGQITCGNLTVFFGASGGGYDRIEATQNVLFVQKEVRALGDKVVYIRDADHVTLTGNASWKAGDKEGAGQTIILNNKTREFRMTGGATVKLVLDKVLPLDWSSTDATVDIANEEPGQLVTITADELDYRADSAVFRNRVRVIDARGGTLSSELLTAAFSADGKLTSLIAEKNVELAQGRTSARGDKAVYSATEEDILITGSPNWKIEQGEGKSDALSFNPKTKQIRADGHVSMKILNVAGGHLDLSLQKTSKAHPTTNTVQIVEIFADESYFKSGSAIFLKNIRIAFPEAVDQGLSCGVLAAFFGGADNKLDQLVAEENVELWQGDLRASGAKAVYLAPKGVIELTGNPQIVTPARRFKTDRFILDRLNNTFRMVGNYRIELDQAALSGSATGKPKE